MTITFISLYYVIKQKEAGVQCHNSILLANMNRNCQLVLWTYLSKFKIINSSEGVLAKCLESGMKVQVKPCSLVFWGLHSGF